MLGSSDRYKLNRMLDQVEHRGPDDSGELIDKSLPIMMGMRRLSIVGLEDGEQPIYNEDGTVAVVFNGEIYNHNELRKELKPAHQFSSSADTEILVHLWEEYDQEMVEKLNGMFAFCIYDLESDIVFIARDRLGIKPLYYSELDGGICWGSNLQSILPAITPEVDPNSLYDYLCFRTVPGNRTLLRVGYTGWNQVTA